MKNVNSLLKNVNHNDLFYNALLIIIVVFIAIIVIKKFILVQDDFGNPTEEDKKIYNYYTRQKEFYPTLEEAEENVREALNL